MSTFQKIVLCGVWEEKGISKVDLFRQNSVLAKRKFLFMSLATRETTKSRVKLDKMILNSRSNPVDNLAELESVNIIFHVKNMDFRVSLLIKLRQLKGKSWKACSNKVSLTLITLIKINLKLLRFYSGFPNYGVFIIFLSFLGRASRLVHSNTEQNDAQKREKAGPKKMLSVGEEFFLVLVQSWST